MGGTLSQSNLPGSTPLVAIFAVVSCKPQVNDTGRLSHPTPLHRLGRVQTAIQMCILLPLATLRCNLQCLGNADPTLESRQALKAA
ncbi:hypothetical protein CGRA01v4_04060 [Colletotrichum graminicola]|nr:hypothetical protein CGRA01v4_04060 [Colletotrichum graminicola]